MTTSEGPPEVRTDRAHSARVYDYFLGGKDNYAADREAAQNVLRALPQVAVLARSQRTFMHRAARLLAEAGVEQFLDIGTGIPTEPNLHQVVQALVPHARVLYVDNDPIVLAHAAALMVGDPRGVVTYLHGDARNPDAVLGSAELRQTLDLTRPLAVSVIGLLHFLDDDAATALVGAVMTAAASGSYLALSHATPLTDGTATDDVVASYRAAGIELWPRTPEQIRALFTRGLELVDPGVTSTWEWRPDGPRDIGGAELERGVLAVVARKP